ncbi:MAG: hypothetical protein HYV29_05335 [Ignavibacteriales bacterium]|nr:hypothetical protein [Ignavibacteriales bacterium]
MKAKLIASLAGYSFLVYLLLLLPFNLYTPTNEFNLPNFLWLTHLLLLYIHEAGHLLFSIFGNTMMIMGGSLMQILAPLAWYFVAQWEGSSLKNTALVFTGVSIVDVSIYVKDAGMLQLPLLGGLSKTHHDWANLMNDWGLIDWSYSFGEMMFWSGMILSAYGIIMGVRHTMTDFRAGGIESTRSSDVP